MTSRERISGVDTAWLRMEQPSNLMMIVGVMMVAGRLGLPQLKRLVRRRFLAFPRFRQRAVQDSSGAWWEDDPRFDLDRHVRRVRLAGAAGKAELEALASRLASTPLDSARPLWQFHLVENYRGGTALIARIHHCYADGIALVRVMLSLSDAAEGSLEAPGGTLEPAADGQADFLQQVLKPVCGAIDGLAQYGLGRQLAARPRVAAQALQEATRTVVDIAADVATLALMGADAPTRLKRALGPRKRVAWADPLPFEDVRAIGKALGGSINDVLLSMAAGALRGYLRDQGDSVDGLEIRAVVPVNLRPDGGATDLGNRFGFVFLDLPVGLEHPLQRLYEVRRRMDALKGSHQPAITLALLQAVGYGPQALQDALTALLARGASLVMTNVPGPRHALHLAGKRIVELDFWVPQSGGIGLGLSILSYDGRIQFGVMADKGLVPDPGRIAARFAQEFDRLMWITLMSPWGERLHATGSRAGTPPRARRARKPRA